MKTVYRILSWLITILTPVVLVLAVARLFFTPAYVAFEYHTPGFPADPYGFTLQDRLNYGTLSVDYLNNSAGISFLGDLRFPAGQQAPSATCQFMTDCTQLFNDRELEHMLDVKNVYQGTLRVAEGSSIFLVLLLLWAWRGKWMMNYLRGLQHGGLLTLILLGLIVLFIVVAFNYFFVIFHEIFFKAGTWTFLYSDTLIRLFPERFWQNTFLFGGSVAALLGLLFFFGFRWLAARYS
ncbi:MAG TPA: TIGR01906 family membrane protein [Anaerolineales bacterium]|nr:TIGR01906 family membrane protein [Anaerolineales bacterium]